MVKHISKLISILLAVSSTFAKEKTITTLRRQRLIKNRLNKQHLGNTRKLEDFTFGPDESTTGYQLPEYDAEEGEGEEITSRRGYAWPPLDPTEIASIEEDKIDGDIEYVVDKPSNPPTWLDDAFGADDFWEGKDDDDEPTASPTWLDEEDHDDDFFWE